MPVEQPEGWEAVSDLVHHEPLHRAPEVVAFEIVVTLGQAYLAGVCLVLAVQTGQPGLAAVVLGVLAVATVAGYGLWLFGGPGTLMTLVNVPLLLLSLFALLVSLQPDATGIAGTIVRSDALGLILQLVAIVSALLGIVGGVFLPGPRRRRWHHAHRPDTPAQPSPVFNTAAAVEQLRASLRRVRSSARARMARGASETEPRAKRAIPTHEDIHGHEPTYQLIDTDDWDREPGADAEAAIEAGGEPGGELGDADDPGAESEPIPYRRPRR
jgi:hypothetical protein